MRVNSFAGYPMRTLHLELEAIARDAVELRYFVDNGQRARSRRLSVAEIGDAIAIGRREEYSPIETDVKTGRRLYDWLNGTDNWLTEAISGETDGWVLAIATPEKPSFVGFGEKVHTRAVTETDSGIRASLSHLPWELLHDGTEFLVEKTAPDVVPVRWMPQFGLTEATPKRESASDRPLQVLFMASDLSAGGAIAKQREQERILSSTHDRPLQLEIEPTGSWEKFGDFVGKFDEDRFDIFHLVIPGNIADEHSYFLPETTIAEPGAEIAALIAKRFPLRFPPLFFLCAYPGSDAHANGAVASIAEALIYQGAKAVLSWESYGAETEATEAMAAFYYTLTCGEALPKAVGKMYRALIENQQPNWHWLRLYVGEMALSDRGLFPGLNFPKTGSSLSG